MRCGSFLIVVLIRQPAQGAARVPGRRRHGWHVRCTSFTGFWLYRSAGHLHTLITHLLTSGNWLSSPPDVCHPSASSDGTRSSKTEVTPRELGSSNARACPELHLACRASHHHHQPSRLLCAQGSETSTPHSTWAREKVRQRTLPSHTRPNHQGGSAYSALTLRFSSPGQARASRSSRSPTTLARRSKQPNLYPPALRRQSLPWHTLRHTFAEPRPVLAPSL